MISKAFAKINLSLDINGVDNRGYHTLESVFLPIDFYDVIEIKKSKKMKYSCNKWYVFFNEKNTIVKAINYMKEKYNIEDNFQVVLSKSIPTQAGLGGGSSDAAAAIRIINKMYKLEMSKEEIKEACMYIGSDVLFTYYNKPAYVKSFGEDISFIELANTYYVLLVKPSFGISTKKSYDKLDMDICDHPDIKKLVSCLKEGKDINKLLGNSLEQSSSALKPEITKIKKQIMEKGGENAIMSGSGSCIFSISTNKKIIDDLASSMKKIGYFVRTTKVIN